MGELRHYRTNGPVCLSFSGGRTSAYMLHQFLLANDGLPNNASICFCNTGKEVEQTLRFVNECSIRWGVPIVWIEYVWNDDIDKRYRLVDFETASRNGEPFDAVIKAKNYLPNPAARFCTIEMKIRPMALYLFDSGVVDTKAEGENGAWLGIRADEQRRAAKIADKSRLPLWKDGVTKQDVKAFWDSQPFDLDLLNVNGVTPEGNCDLCFLKGAGLIESLIQKDPSVADWWINAEATTLASKPLGGRFRSDRPSYKAMKEATLTQQSLFDDFGTSIDCFCGD